MCLTCFTITVLERNESTHIVWKVGLFTAAKTAIRAGENLCKINAPAGMQKRQEAARALTSDGKGAIFKRCKGQVRQGASIRSLHHQPTT